MSEVFLCKHWGGKCEWSIFCANGGNQCCQLWVSLSGKTKRVESQMANSRWLPSSSCVRINRWSSFCANVGEASVSEVFFVQMVGTNVGNCEWVWEEKLRGLNPRWQIQDGRIQDGCHHHIEWNLNSEILFCAKWLNPREQNSRWLPSSS